MSKVVNDDYPNSVRLTDEEIKAKFLAESTNTGTMETFQKLDVPTEIIDLPSRGYFYPEGHPLSSGKIEMKYMTAKEMNAETRYRRYEDNTTIPKYPDKEL
jgi:hypothetical protein